MEAQSSRIHGGSAGSGNIVQRAAIVTGAGSGIGRAVAIALLNAGYRVILAGRRAHALAETADLANTENGCFQAIDFSSPYALAETALANAEDAVVQVTDVTSPASVAHLFDRCREEFGRLDLLFNNAGVWADQVEIGDMPIQSWQRVVDTNITGYFLCIQQAFRLMAGQTPMGGRIINNGSVAAIAPRPNSMPYTASKHAITGMTKSALLDGRKYNIACSQIDIGNALSDMSAAFTTGTEQADGTTRPEPTIDPAHVADAVLRIAAMPLEANIPFMIIMPTRMPLFGRG